MTQFINVAAAGDAPRIVNLDHVVEFTPWKGAKGEDGTTLRTSALTGTSGTSGATLASLKITVATPFSEIMRRIKSERLSV